MLPYSHIDNLTLKLSFLLKETVTTALISLFAVQAFLCVSVLQRKDLLELMLRAEVNYKDSKHVSKLSDDEVLAQSFTFILAGYETTSNALAYTTYCLALNPEVQEKLIEEIDEAVGDKVSIKQI